jgi:peptidoglycan/xylan/chitin deacetylase (PgdA/CDA1 family)
MKDFYFTTSWDDGSVNDLRLLKLLKRFDIKGTFFIPQNFNNNDAKYSSYIRRLTAEEIKTISLTQEIGAHSLSHRILTELSDEEIIKEVSESRVFLEEITGKKINIFSFPGGIFNEKIIDTVKNIGYIGARTAQLLNFKISSQAFLFGVSVQCNPFPFRKTNAEKYNWRRLLDPMRTYDYKLLSFIPLIPRLYSWQSFARAFFKYSMNSGNYFHLVGHSWELEKYGMWDELESFLKFVKSQKKEIKFVTNSEVANFIKQKQGDENNNLIG